MRAQLALSDIGLNSLGWIYMYISPEVKLLSNIETEHLVIIV